MARKPLTDARKQASQKRSRATVDALVEATARILVKAGFDKASTNRIAEEAGVSIGSLYQYFPNKAAILFRLQSDEWRQTTTMLRVILEDSAAPPPRRLRHLVHAFIVSECAEAAMRVALNDAAPLYRDAPEAAEVRTEGEETIARFMREALPDAAVETRAMAGGLITTTLSEVGKRFSETSRSAAEIAAYADAMATMFCAYLETMNRG